jgi:uncharacterized alpha-E superfamily protein
VLSRVAENMYWLGRYLERADNVARLADVNVQATTDSTPAGGGNEWEAVIATLGATEAYEDALTAQPDLTPADFLIYSPYPQSLRSTVATARSIAREVREHISREVFEEINRLYLGTNRGDTDERSLRQFYATVKRAVATILGLFDNTVLLTEGREWFHCGLFLERAEMTSRIIDAKYFILLPEPDDVGGPRDRYQWMAVLRSASALEAYRKQEHGPVTGPRVADLLMFDQDFPRSMVYCVAQLRHHYERAVAQIPMARSVYAAREIAILEYDLRAADARNVIRSGLHEFVDVFQARLGVIDEALREHLFRAVPEEPER